MAVKKSRSALRPCASCCSKPPFCHPLRFRFLPFSSQIPHRPSRNNHSCVSARVCVPAGAYLRVRACACVPARAYLRAYLRVPDRPCELVLYSCRVALCCRYLNAILTRQAAGDRSRRQAVGDSRGTGLSGEGAAKGYSSKRRCKRQAGPGKRQNGAENRALSRLLQRRDR